MSSLPEQKQCTKCERWLPITMFARRRKGLEKRRSHCNDCVNECQRDRRHKLNPPSPPKYKDGLRRCTKCEQYLPLDTFGQKSANPDGLRYQCKKCAYEYKCQHRREYRDEYNAYQREYYKAHPEEAQEYARRSRARNGDQIKAYSIRYYRDRSEEIKAYVKQWQHDNPERCAEYSLISRHKRRALINSNGGSFTAEEWIALCEHYNHRCLCCGERKPLTIDHVIPVSRGGSNDIFNLQPLCQSCNSSKGTQTIDYR